MRAGLLGTRVVTIDGEWDEGIIPPEFIHMVTPAMRNYDTAVFIAAAPTDTARLLAAVKAVVALHEPERCWMPYEGAEVSYATEQEAIEAMEDCDLNQVAMQAIAENGTPFFEVCAECRRVENGPCEGECVREMGYLTSLWPCPTVAAVVAALGGEA